MITKINEWKRQIITESIDSKIQKKVDEINDMISKAVDSEGDKLGVYDASSTWEAPMYYDKIEFKNGRLKISYEEYTGHKPEKKSEIISKKNLELDGIGTLNNIAKMYRKALKKANKPAKDTNESKKNKINNMKSDKKTKIRKINESAKYKDGLYFVFDTDHDDSVIVTYNGKEGSLLLVSGINIEIYNKDLKDFEDIDATDDEVLDQYENDPDMLVYIGEYTGKDSIKQLINENKMVRSLNKWKQFKLNESDEKDYTKEYIDKNNMITSESIKSGEDIEKLVLASEGELNIFLKSKNINYPVKMSKNGKYFKFQSDKILRGTGAFGLFEDVLEYAYYSNFGGGEIISTTWNGQFYFAPKLWFGNVNIGYQSLTSGSNGMNVAIDKDRKGYVRPDVWFDILKNKYESISDLGY